MATEKQVAANRANAKKSTGPSSPEGRLKSSQNSTRHGLLAKALILEGESLDRFRRLLSAFLEDLRPQSLTETSLVESMAVSRWRQMRIWCLERTLLDTEIEKQSNGPNLTFLEQDAPTRAALAFRALVDQTRSLDALSRYEATCSGNFDRALGRLLKLREKSEISKRSQFENEKRN